VIEQRHSIALVTLNTLITTIFLSIAEPLIAQQAHIDAKPLILL